MQEIIADWNELTVAGKAFVVFGTAALFITLAYIDRHKK